MQFHHHGYVSGEPRVQDAAAPASIALRASRRDGRAHRRSGPAACCLRRVSQFPGVTTRIIERRDGRLVLGQADGIQPRSVETFQAFGFAERIVAEAYNIAYMNFWGPTPRTRATSCAPRAPRTTLQDQRVPPPDRQPGARAGLLRRGRRVRPRPIVPDYGVEFLGLTVHDEARTRSRCGCGTRAGERAGEERTVARSTSRDATAPQRRARGDRRAARRRISAHAWGVMDVSSTPTSPTGAPSARSTRGGQHPPHPARGRLPQPHVHRPRRGRRRRRPPRAPDADRRDHPQANDILRPYSIDVKQVAWHSVYEVGHRVTEFDDVTEVTERDPACLPHGRRLPHAQREGRAGHERVDAGRLQPRLEARQC